MKYILLNLLCMMYFVSIAQTESNTIGFKVEDVSKEPIMKKKSVSRSLVYDTIKTEKLFKHVCFKIYYHDGNDKIHFSTAHLKKSECDHKIVYMREDLIMNKKLGVGPLNIIDNYATGWQAYYDINDNIDVKYHLKNGYLNGKFIRYYPNGKINYKGRYKNHGRKGKWVYYYENGERQSVSKFKPNVLVFDYNYSTNLCNIYTEKYLFSKSIPFQEVKEKVDENHIRAWTADNVLYCQIGWQKNWDEKGDLVSKKKYTGEDFHGMRKFVEEYK